MRSLVHLTAGRYAGTGWVVELGGRTLVVTNRHVIVTTEGVIAGGVSHLPGTQTGTCGTRRACLLIDAETEPGSSGGPVLNERSEVIGMVWGSWPNTSLTLAIHAHVLAMALRRVEELAQTPDPAPTGG
ncbi:MAG: serine protease [Myxococcales bacterium]|nr:serine protease [Myxococcales bacterium]